MATTSLANAFAYGLLIAILSLVGGVRGYTTCPADYPFPSCPRLNDPADYTTCCRINGYPQCCDTTIIAAWAIWVSVVMSLIGTAVIALIVCACCPCCWLASRRRRTQYVVVANDAPTYPAPSTTTTTYVYDYNTPQQQQQSNYNPTAQPPPPTYSYGK